MDNLVEAIKKNDMGCMRDRNIREKIAEKYNVDLQDVTSLNTTLTMKWFIEYVVKGERKPVIVIPSYCPICGRKID